MVQSSPAQAPSPAARAPSLEGIYRARERLRRFMEPSPLYRSAALSRALDADVWLKVETTSPIASFKLRGALNTLLSMKESGEALASAVTSSTGNHGQGVALAASWLEMPADIFVPKGTDPIKQAMIKLFGAKLHIGGHDLDEAKEIARGYATETHGAFVDDGEEAAVIEGAGTIGVEIAEALTKIDTVFAPMGSGSLASGTAIGLKGLQPDAQLIAVQSSASPAMVESFRARRAIELPADTLAGCLVCRVPAHVALEALIRHVDDCWLVDDADLFAAMHALVAWGHLFAELGATAGLAGAWSRRAEIRGRRIVILVTGANSNPETLSEALTRAPLFDEAAFQSDASVRRAEPQPAG